MQRKFSNFRYFSVLNSQVPKTKIKNWILNRLKMRKTLKFQWFVRRDIPFTHRSRWSSEIVYYATKDKSELLHVESTQRAESDWGKKCAGHVNSLLSFVRVSHFPQFLSRNSTWIAIIKDQTTRTNLYILCFRHPSLSNRDVNNFPPPFFLFSSPFLIKRWCKLPSVTLFSLRCKARLSSVKWPL